ncbi:unnamed protein product [Gongylonema pulchrum]|uniref:Secreted protein n=1 Tax=Gongylonema pulchrum TaxID=637853 RepID=A0A183D6I5_9BILA|nr:unnamed protein product [Gongylonema pulchrum]
MVMLIVLGLAFLKHISCKFMNRFSCVVWQLLLRFFAVLSSKTPEDAKKKKRKKERKGDTQTSAQRFSRRDYGHRRDPPTRRTRTGHKIKGRGALRFRTPDGSDHDGSRTPPHWRREEVVVF